MMSDFPPQFSTLVHPQTDAVNITLVHSLTSINRKTNSGIDIYTPYKTTTIVLVKNP